MFIDEHLARTAIATNGQTQSQAQLTDALGSVIALANAQTLSINTSYNYSPYGQTQATGETSNNNQQYTGREAGIEGEAGLYYYRARYYDPVLKRFISEDPIGLSCGLNVYAYVEGMPTIATDPTGNQMEMCRAGLTAWCPLPKPTPPPPLSQTEKECDVALNKCMLLAGLFEPTWNFSVGMMSGGTTALLSSKTFGAVVGAVFGMQTPKPFGMDNEGIKKGYEAGYQKCKSKCPPKN